ncbi:bifunctional demethylmenaquinone methyltransferase/2-methoxy-6-polyprenyl-1,4-benzoquinol methylase UbiE [Pyruvatibacter mobilis]|uniref:bifunctional demethylmenaquinone methyltransferase/2-methoxy-6-polyprenyl-1,4-benzoquinol methylase UbiE n=1 Tax=Pyruvatibacter mobilis TaxID=1712261 RepID=UPI003BAF8B8A
MTDMKTDAAAGGTGPADPPSNATHFGFRDVAPDEKQGLVNGVFRNVAGNYDLMNDFMSVGVHRLWKDAMVSWLAPRKSGAPFTSLDMAGGTGDIALRIAHRSGGHARVMVADINDAMLGEGKKRAATDAMGDRLSFACMNAEKLPLEPRQFDAYTIAFGIRNVPDLDAALSEAHRVLKPGGRFMCLEFSRVVVPILDDIYERWSFDVIPWLGQMVAGDRDSYQYLVESIRKFPDQKAFEGRIRDAGFSRVTHRNFTGGIAAIHSGYKI